MEDMVELTVDREQECPVCGKKMFLNEERTKACEDMGGPNMKHNVFLCEHCRRLTIIVLFADGETETLITDQPLPVEWYYGA